MTTEKPGNIKSAATMASYIGQADNYNRWLLSLFHNYIGDKVLEVGTGMGNFRKYLKDTRGYVSIDIDADAVENAQNLYPDAKFYVADISSPYFQTDLLESEFDSILCINVLEHVKEDRSGIENMLGKLKRGGCLLLFVPAFPKLYGDMDSLAGHHRRYTINSAKSLFEGTESSIVETGYFNSLGAIGWWMNRSLKSQDIDSLEINRQVKIFDLYLVPLAKLCDYFTKRFFGQSLFIVARKK